MFFVRVSNLYLVAQIYRMDSRPFYIKLIIDVDNLNIYLKRKWENFLKKFIEVTLSEIVKSVLLSYLCYHRKSS